MLVHEGEGEVHTRAIDIPGSGTLTVPVGTDNGFG